MRCTDSTGTKTVFYTFNIRENLLLASKAALEASKAVLDASKAVLEPSWPINSFFLSILQTSETTTRKYNKNNLFIQTIFILHG